MHCVISAQASLAGIRHSRAKRESRGLFHIHTYYICYYRASGNSEPKRILKILILDVLPIVDSCCRGNDRISTVDSHCRGHDGISIIDSRCRGHDGFSTVDSRCGGHDGILYFALSFVRFCHFDFRRNAIIRQVKISSQAKMTEKPK